MIIWSSKFVFTTEKFESGVMIGIDFGGHFKKPKCGNGKSQLKSHCVALAMLMPYYLSSLETKDQSEINNHLIRRSVISLMGVASVS